jgi:hypothetical protein
MSEWYFKYHFLLNRWWHPTKFHLNFLSFKCTTFKWRPNSFFCLNFLSHWFQSHLKCFSSEWHNSRNLRLCFLLNNLLQFLKLNSNFFSSEWINLWLLIILGKIALNLHWGQTHFNLIPKSLTLFQIALNFETFIAILVITFI